MIFETCRRVVRLRQGLAGSGRVHSKGSICDGPPEQRSGLGSVLEYRHVISRERGWTRQGWFDNCSKMLATTTTDTLTIADLVVIKKAPPSIPTCLSLPSAPVASSWSPDNVFLFIASGSTIHKFDPSSNTLCDIYTASKQKSIYSLVSKDKNTVVFALDHDIHVLDCSTSLSEITHTFTSHKGPVTSLSLSNDNSLLASASAGFVYVHNLALGSHIPLRGMGADVSKVLFHLHSRTRLLVSAARQILVYDTTRPSVPLKTISLSDSAPGDIISFASSPFSKTLIAIVTSAGIVAMIDLEKEKAYVV